MKISELRKGPFEGSVEGTIVELGEVKDITTKFGRQLRVVNGTLQDDSGSIGLALWNEDVDKFKEGDRIRITNGYVSVFNEELKVSSGRNGVIEKI